MTINRIHARHISAAVVPAASGFTGRMDAQALNMDGQSGVFLQPLAEDVPSLQNNFGGPKRIQGEAIQAASICQSPSLSSRVACTIALCLALAGIIADPTTCHAQSPSERTPATSENAMKPNGHPAQDQIALARHRSPLGDEDQEQQDGEADHAPFPELKIRERLRDRPGFI